MVKQLNYLTREDILAAHDVVDEDVLVPEWGGVVKVRGLRGFERDEFESEMVEFRGKNTVMNLTNFRAKLVSRSLVDKDGTRVFTDEDVKVLGERGAAALQRVFKVAQRLSGLAEDEVEELTKSLGEGHSDASGSA